VSVTRNIDERPLLVVPSNPTPNGDLHVGHLAGPFVAADVCRRAARLRGERAHLLLGTAWHESHVALKAEQTGLSSRRVAAWHTAEILRTFAAAAIEPEAMVEPSADAEVAALARKTLAGLAARRALVVRDGSVQHCLRCRRDLFGGFVTGTCPRCGESGASGTDCEACVRYHDDGELVDAACAVCGAAAVARTTRRAYLPLEPLRRFFEGYLAGVTATPPVRRYFEAVLSAPLPDVAVTSSAPVGIDVADGSPTRQRLVPAFSLPARFVVALQQLAPDGRDCAAVARDARVVLVFGFDNAFERVFLFPALLRALTRRVPLPDTLLMSHFYRLDGAKFSTSRNHVVWARDLIAASSTDEVRYHVAATRPEAGETDFSRAGFEHALRGGFVESARVWADDVLDRAHGTFNGIAPAPRRLDGAARDFRADVQRLVSEVWAAYEPASFSCTASALRLAELLGRARRFADAARRADAPLELRATETALELATVRALALAAAPITPGLAAELFRALGEPRPSEQRWNGRVAWLQAGRRLRALAEA
jgi:methionyl-tRNA synthetase